MPPLEDAPEWVVRPPPRPANVAIVLGRFRVLPSHDTPDLIQKEIYSMRLLSSRFLVLLTLIGLTLSVVLPAYADVKIVARKWFSGLDDVNAKNDVQFKNVDRTYTYYYKGEKYREDSSGSRFYFVYDCANDKYYTIDREGEVYSIQTLQDALTKRKGLLAQFKVAGKAKVEPGGSTRTIAGKPSKNYTMSMDVQLNSAQTGATIITVKMEGEQWVTNTAQISPKCQKILKAAYARGIFRYNAIMEPLFSQLEGVQGIPLSYDMILNLSAVAVGVEGGTIEAHSDVTAISTATLPASLFDVPKGFRLVPKVQADDAN